MLSEADGFMNRDQNRPEMRGEYCLPEQRTSLWARQSERTSTHNNMRSHRRGQQNITAKRKKCTDACQDSCSPCAREANEERTECKIHECRRKLDLGYLNLRFEFETLN